MSTHLPPPSLWSARFYPRFALPSRGLWKFPYSRRLLPLWSDPVIKRRSPFHGSDSMHKKRSSSSTMLCRFLSSTPTQRAVSGWLHLGQRGWGGLPSSRKTIVPCKWWCKKWIQGWCGVLPGTCRPKRGTPPTPLFWISKPYKVGSPPEAGCYTTVDPGQSRYENDGAPPLTRTPGLQSNIESGVRVSDSGFYMQYSIDQISNSILWNFSRPKFPAISIYSFFEVQIWNHHCAPNSF